MRLLLDTHVLLHALAGGDDLSGTARSAIASQDSLAFVSAASVWEISIKRRIGKLEVSADLGETVVASRFEPLDVTFRHAEAAGALPLHHRDPFDRMLVAQAQLEGLTLVTDDPHISRYAVHTMPASGA